MNILQLASQKMHHFFFYSRLQYRPEFVSNPAPVSYCEVCMVSSTVYVFSFFFFLISYFCNLAPQPTVPFKFISPSMTLSQTPNKHVAWDSVNALFPCSLCNFTSIFFVCYVNVTRTQLFHSFSAPSRLRLGWHLWQKACTWGSSNINRSICFFPSWMLLKKKGKP